MHSSNMPRKRPDAPPGYGSGSSCRCGRSASAQAEDASSWASWTSAASIAARSCSLGGGVISRFIPTQAKVPRDRGRSEERVGRRLLIAVAVFTLVPAGAAAASVQGGAKPSRSWAAPEIRTVAAAGLMGAADAASFRPDDPLTAQTLEDLVFGLKQTVFPPDPTPAPAPVPLPPAPNPAAPVPVDPAAPVPPPTTTTATTTTTTTPAPVPAPAPTAPRKAPQPDAPVTMAQLDLRLVQILGLSKAANEFTAGARTAGLKVPGRFGTEVVARLLGLRTNHPASDDSPGLLPNDHATRAGAPYSAAQVLHFSGWEVAGVQGLADNFALPALSNWQTAILDTAVARIGMPYIWGGTSDGPES